MSIIFQDEYPAKYLDQQTVASKQLNMVVEIEGIENPIAIVPTYRPVRYGDPGIYYGQDKLVYGALVVDPNVKIGLSLESQLVISQKLEPEQGRGSVTTMTLVFVDIDQYFSKLISPGQLLDDILGNKLIKVRVGYQNTAYPQDYLVCFRGYASNTRAQSGRVTIQLSDANLKRRADVFTIQKTQTSADIDALVTNIPVIATDGFSKRIMGPDGTYDPSARTFIQVEDELMEYDQNGIVDGTTFAVTRGAMGTIAAAHDMNSDVSQRYVIEGNLIDIALKVMLSGWGGPWSKDQPVLGLKNGLDFGIENNLIRFPDGTDLIDKYNLSEGDYVYLTGSTMGNDGTYQVQSIASSTGQINNLLFLEQNLVAQEYPATSVRLAFRSKYDTFPRECGTKMRTSDIDMGTWQDTRDTFYNTSYTNMRFIPGDSISAKTFIERELLLPASLYSVTRFGRISVKITLPPIAGQKIIQLDISNVLEADKITIERALNTRRFFNDVRYSYDLDPVTGDYLNKKFLLDSDSLNLNDLDSVLPIQSQGLRSDLFADEFTEKKGINLLSRYKNAAFELQNIVTNWGTGSLIEAGDVVLVKDDKTLQITNLTTGERNFGTQLLEVIDRSIDIKTGRVSIKLLSNIGYQVGDRFATISPTSQVAATGSSNSTIKIQDSFGAEFPGNEQEKWRILIGSQIYIHKKDYSDGYVRTLTGFMQSDRYMMILDSPIPVVPDSDWVVDVDEFPDTPNTFDNQTLKLLFCFIDPSVEVIAGISNTQFTVPLARIDTFTVGNPISVHNSDFSQDSPETTVKSITGNQIEVAKDLGFTPTSGELAELIGFPDGSGPYRIL